MVLNFDVVLGENVPASKREIKKEIMENIMEYGNCILAIYIADIRVEEFYIHSEEDAEEYVDQTFAVYPNCTTDIWSMYV